MTGPRPRIALLPLDDRPVNVLLPRDVAAAAGVDLDVPPIDALPDFRTPGNPDALAAWLRERADDPSTVHLVVSIDMLVFGGLIASRTSHDSTEQALRRLDVLRDIRRRHPHLPISAVSLVMRASNSYSATEEPDYWTQYGKDLHAFGGDVHRRLGEGEIASLESLTGVPPETVTDFSRRRLRNHIVNLTMLDLLEDGTIDFLAITADDTATYSAGSAEQVWLRHWMRMLPAGRGVMMYPGADEVGAVLVARALAEHADVEVSFTVACAEDDGLERIPPYENIPLASSVLRQIRAAGAVERASDTDVTLVIHAPDPGRHDMTAGRPSVIDTAAVAGTVALVEAALDAGERVAVADVRFANGADEALVRALADIGLLTRLDAYGGWNTAGNTMGSVVALASAAAIGRASGGFDARAARLGLATRLLDDFAYQAVVRVDSGPDLFPDFDPLTDTAQIAAAEERIRTELSEVLASVLPNDVRIDALTLPWKRSFEIGLELS